MCFGTAAFDTHTSQYAILYQKDFSEYSQYQMPGNQTVSHSQSIFHQKNNFNFLALV